MPSARARALVAALILLASSAALLGVPRATADPFIIENPDGTADAVWNFTNPTDYTLVDAEIAGGAVSLRQLTSWWNSTSAADFAGPDSATNVDLARWPGDVVLTATSGPSTLLVVQPDGAAGIDTWLDRNNANTNHGAETTMILDGRNPQSRPVLWFDLSGIPPGATVDGATLNLYQSAGVGASFTASVYQVIATWDENQATWNNRLTGTAWGNAGGDFNGHVIAQITLDNTAGWRSWNVTQLADLWYRGRIANQGLILNGPNTGADADKTFYTSDYTVDPSLRPRLEIWYRVVVGATGVYVSKVGGPGTQAAWQTVSWSPDTRSLVADEFNGASLDPKWTWTNPPPSYDVGGTTPGHLHVVSATGVEISGAAFSGNVLADEIVGDFNATMKFSTNPTAGGQKAGLMAFLGSRDWYGVQKRYDSVSATMRWQIRSTVDAATTTRVDIANANPIPAWVRIVRIGDTFESWTSDDGVAWVLRDTYTPAYEYPVAIRLAFFAADGLSGVPIAVDVDYLRVTHGTDATVSVSTRTGDTSPVDGTWSGWSAPYPSPGGSAIGGTSRHIEFRVSLAVTSPEHTPVVGDVNVSWTNRRPSGSVETRDLVPGDVEEWGNLTVVHALSGQSVAYEYSLDGGGSWTPVAPPASLQAVSIATGRIRFRASLSTTDTLVTPTVSEVRLTYRHALDHFHVTASPAASAGSSFTVTVTAKDAANSTLTGWTGTVTLAALLVDGVTPGGGVLGATSLAIASGGTATLPTQTYTKAEAIRIRASFGGSTGLSGAIAISSGPVARVVVTPDNVTLLPFDVLTFSAQAYDAWDNPVPGAIFAWTVLGGVGTLNASTGPSVAFTAQPPADVNGSLDATSGGVTGAATIRVASGTRPSIAITSPAAGDHLRGVVPVAYTNSSDAVRVTFEYDGGGGWTLIGSTGVVNGTFLWDTAGLDFLGGSLRGTVENNRTITNSTTVSPFEVDNTPPTISLGAITDNQATSGTISIAYTTVTDVVRVDFRYFDGAWRGIGSDLTVDGSFVWAPAGPINGVTLEGTGVDDVGLTGSAFRQGIGNRTLGTNPPRIAAIPDLRVRTGAAYGLNLTFYVSDPDTPLAALAVTVSDSANFTATPGPYPSLSVTYGAAGTYAVTLWVSDGTDTAWTVLRVIASGGTPPALSVPIPTVAFDEDTVATNGFGSPATSFFLDADGEPMGFVLIGGVQVGHRVNGDSTVDFWAAANWSGSESLRIRASDPSGGFAEAAFLVVVRPVNDAPRLAAVPPLQIDEGAIVALDLTPYVSDIDTNLSQLVVTTDSPYVTANGFVLTVAFPADRSEATFTITLSDGSASDSRTVRATFIPPWWKAPYVLAIPPVGVLAVFAVFAQRARWRPAKAFLVDERQRLLREFTLDPKCTVTFEEAVAAGALGAVEKPVKVAKYHAQTVRGDALAVTVLTYGPITGEQIEFAREMLVNIQEKLDDGTKARLEEARGAETEAVEAQRASDRARAALDVKSRALTEMSEGIAAAQTKMAAEAAASRAKSQDIDLRETRLREERGELDRMAGELNAQRGDLEHRLGDVANREGDAEARHRDLDAREARIAPLESELSARESTVSEREAAVAGQADLVGKRALKLQEEAKAVADREAAIARDRADLDDARDTLQGGRTSFDEEVNRFRGESARRKEELDALAKDLFDQQQTLIREMETFETTREKKTNWIESKEKELAARDKTLREREAQVKNQSEAVVKATAKAQEREEVVGAREAAVTRRESQLDEAQKGFEADRTAFEGLAARFQEEAGQRQTTLDAREEALADGQRVLKGERDTFETSRAERAQWIASKEIELESREESLRGKEDAVRAQAEENAHRLADLAAREEALEIEADRQEKIQTQLDARKSESERVGADLEKRATELRELEAKKAEEYRTWQATLESQQAVLRRDREALDQQATEQKEAWALRTVKAEQREQEIGEREAKVHGDVEWTVRMDEELKRREIAAEAQMKQATALNESAEALDRELTQRAMDIDTRERKVREEAAKLTDQFARRAHAIRTAETEFDEKTARVNEEMGARESSVQAHGLDLNRLAKALDARSLDLDHRQAKLAGLQESLTAQEERLARDRSDVQTMVQQVEALQVDIEQAQQRNEEESARLQSEAQSMRTSLAAKESDLRSEQERLERESTALQEKLGAEAQTLAARDKALDAKEAESRTREQALEARIREVESREREARAQAGEISARAAELEKSRKALDESIKRLATEEAEKRGAWENVQAALRTREAQIASQGQALDKDFAGRLAILDKREQALTSAMTQLQADRGALEEAAKVQAAKDGQAAAAIARAETRHGELKAMETELLRTRQGFESERSAWGSRRAEELRQLEKTRSAAEEQIHRSEELVEETQRRGLMAADAEKAARRQAEELARKQAEFEKRRGDAERAERALEAQTAQLQEASRNLAGKEMALDAKTRELREREGRIESAAQEGARAMEGVKARHAGLDAEANRLAKLANELETRRKEADARIGAAEAKLADVAQREHVLTAELQRVEGLMEDLNRKKAELEQRDRTLAGRDSEASRRDTEISRREAAVQQGMSALDRTRSELEERIAEVDRDRATARTARDEALAAKTEADRMRAQAEEMQREVQKSMKFLQKKAVDTLDHEEKIRGREARVEESEKALEARAEILDAKERTQEDERTEMAEKIERLQAEVGKLKSRLTGAEQASASTAEIEERQRDVENRIKIVQRKALELLDREEKLRKKEEELKALAERLGMTP